MQQCDPQFIIMPLNSLEVYDHKKQIYIRHETVLLSGICILTFNCSSLGSLPKPTGPFLAGIPDAQLDCHHSAGTISNLHTKTNTYKDT